MVATYMVVSRVLHGRRERPSAFRGIAVSGVERLHSASAIVAAHEAVAIAWCPREEEKG